MPTDRSLQHKAQLGLHDTLGCYFSQFCSTHTRPRVFTWHNSAHINTWNLFKLSIYLFQLYSSFYFIFCFFIHFCSTMLICCCLNIPWISSHRWIFNLFFVTFSSFWHHGSLVQKTETINPLATFLLLTPQSIFLSTKFPKHQCEFYLFPSITYFATQSPLV